MVILSIDYGQKHIGLAISDAREIVCTPIDPIHITKSTTKETLIESFKKVISDYRVEKLLFGMPQIYKESHSVNRDRINAFIQFVTSNINIPYEIYDESFSTSSAKHIIISNGANFKKKKRSIDSIAASVFLTEYLESKK